MQSTDHHIFVTFHSASIFCIMLDNSMEGQPWWLNSMVVVMKDALSTRPYHAPAFLDQGLLTVTRLTFVGFHLSDGAFLTVILQSMLIALTVIICHLDLSDADKVFKKREDWKIFFTILEKTCFTVWRVPWVQGEGLEMHYVRYLTPRIALFVYMYSFQTSCSVQ